MNNTRESIDLVLYNYYPQNIDSISQRDLYIESKEFKNLQGIISENQNIYEADGFDFIGYLKGKYHGKVIFNDVTYFQWMDRCFTFEFIEKKENLIWMTKTYLSILTPVATMKFFKVSMNKTKANYMEVFETEFHNQQLISQLRILINDNGYTFFDSKLLSEKIEDINFDDIEMGNFTYFNAFFNSQNF